MWNWVENLVNLCTSKEVEDESLWSRALVGLASGEFSMAVVQAHAKLQDQSQVLSGNKVTFVAVFDGNGFPEASAYHCDNTFPNFTVTLQGAEDMFRGDILSAHLTAQYEFLAQNPAAPAPWCLIGVIWKGELHILSKGNSRAVLGTLEQNRIKEFVLNRYHSQRPETTPIAPAHKFVIFGSDGLWAEMSHKDAVQIVSRNSKEGIAKRLVETAVKRAAKKHRVSPNTVKRCPRGDRTQYHDDITAIVVFLDHGLIMNHNHVHDVPPVSVRCYVDDDVETDFSVFVQLLASSSQGSIAVLQTSDVAFNGSGAALQNDAVASQGSVSAPHDDVVVSQGSVSATQEDDVASQRSDVAHEAHGGALQGADAAHGGALQGADAVQGDDLP